MNNPSADARKKNLQRFEREARSAAKVQIEGVVSIRDAGEFHGNPYIAMDFVEGATLDEFWEESKTKDVNEAVRIATIIARSLSHIHRAGIIHRDIKPANILMDTTVSPPMPKITDFSLAMLTDPMEQRLTQTGATVGTPYYMSPEQTMGKREDIGAHSDIYSLGAVLYEMLCGSPPFRAKSLRELYAKIQRQPAASLNKKNQGVSLELEKIIFKALEKLPRIRFKNSQKFAEAMENYLGGKKVVLGEPDYWDKILSFLLLHQRIIRNGAIALLLFLFLLPLISKVLSVFFPKKRTLVVKDIAKEKKQQQVYKEKQISILLESVRKLNKKGKKNKAINELRAALKERKHPSHMENLLWLAMEFQERKNQKLFWYHIERWYDLDPEDYLMACFQIPEDWFLRSLGFFYAGYPSTAKKILAHGRRILKNKNREQLQSLLHGQLLWLTGWEGRGKKILANIDHPFYQGENIPIPLFLLAKGNIAAAQKYSQKLLQESKSSRWLMTAGLIAMADKKFPKAYTYFEQIPSFEFEEYNKPARYYSAICLYYQREYKKAWELFKKLTSFPKTKKFMNKIRKNTRRSKK